MNGSKTQILKRFWKLEGKFRVRYTLQLMVKQDNKIVELCGKKLKKKFKGFKVLPLKENAKHNNMNMVIIFISFKIKEL